MSVLLIRHAHYSWLGARLAGHTRGLLLSGQGLAEAKALAERLRETKLAAIITSPLERTRETAEIIALPHGLTPVADERWIDLDFGTWTGKTFRELDADKDWHRWNRERASATTPGGETMMDVLSRALAAVADLPPGDVAVVTHADVIRALVLQAAGRSLDHIHKLEVEPASVTIYAGRA